MRLELGCNGGACPSGGSYQIRAELVNTATTWTSTSWFTLTDVPHNVEFGWQRSASGSLTFWIDGAQQANLTGVNNSNRVIDRVRLGPVAGIDTGTRGAYFLDSFDSRRYNYIGGQAQQRGQTILARLWEAFTGGGQTDSASEQAAGNLAASLSATPWETPIVRRAATSHRLAKPSAGFARTQQPSGLASNGELVTTVITYTYDGLQRLTAADYNSGVYFHYTYDAVGNRLSQTFTGRLVATYTYDIANRLIALGTVTQTWDANGNLLSDGTSEYAYDAANRLISVTQGDDDYAFSYNGRGDRLSQTVNGVPTYYSLDLVAGLTQVLDDGTNSYLYGRGRLGELQAGGFVYHLVDGIGSVRQLVQTNGDVLLARSYEPFGNALTSVGDGVSAFQFTGEQHDATGLIFLRARYLAPQSGRFLQIDPARLEQHDYLYAKANPVTRSDPSGLYSREQIAASFNSSGNFEFLLGVLEMADQGKWGFIAAMLVANDGDYISLGSPILVSPSPYVSHQPRQLVWSLCDEIFVGALPLADYFSNRVMRPNTGLELPIVWRDTSPSYYSVTTGSGQLRAVFVDGSDQIDYPDFHSIDAGLRGNRNFSAVVDRFGNVYVAFGAAVAGVGGGVSYSEGYVCDIPGYCFSITPEDENALLNTIKDAWLGGCLQLDWGGCYFATLTGDGVLVYSTGIALNASLSVSYGLVAARNIESLSWNWAIEQRLGGVRRDWLDAIASMDWE